MNSPIKRILVPFLLLMLLNACASATQSPEAAPTSQGISPYHGIQLDALRTYQASFLLQFEGTDPWSYFLTIRSDGDQLERSLHIEGVEAARNPGDVRMVTQGDQNRIQGPGTEGECLIFPTNIDLGPAFFLPDDLIPVEVVGPSLQDLGKDAVAGLDTSRFGLRSDQLGGWKNIQIDVWLEKSEGSTMRYDLQLSGEDPFFGRGQGSFQGRFVIESIGPQAIEPIPGCEIKYPIPDSAKNLVKLPGLIEFDSPGEVNDLTSYYQDALAQSGWNAVGEPEQSGDVLIMSYQEGDQSLEIVLERQQEGVHVKLLPG